MRLLERATGPRIASGSNVLPVTTRRPSWSSFGSGISYDVSASAPGGFQLTAPWQSGPKRFVGGSPGPSVSLVSPGDFVEGAHLWGPVAGDTGFPHGSRFPGWPGDWGQPFFTKGEDGGRARLTRHLSVVWSCTDLISRTLAMMPVRVSKDSMPTEPPAWTVNPEPLIYASWSEFLKQVVVSMLLRGSGYVYVTARYADGFPARFVCLDPDAVQVTANADGSLTWTLHDKLELTSDDLLVIHYQTWPGVPGKGVGPLQGALQNVASAESLAGYASQLAGRGGVPSAVLQSSVPLNARQAQDLKSAWRSSVESGGVEPVVLTSSLTYQPLSLNPADLAMLETRTFDEQRIASAFGVPLNLIGLPAQDSLTYSTAESNLSMFWQSCLRPLADTIASALSLWALPSQTFCSLDADQFVRPTLVERANAYATLISSGVMQPDEARIAEGWAPLGLRPLDPISEGQPVP